MVPDSPREDVVKLFFLFFTPHRSVSFGYLFFLW